MQASVSGSPFTGQGSAESIVGDGSGCFFRSKKKGKTKGGMMGMVSAMIPGAKVNNKGRVMVNVATSKETMIFNIGGVLFETYRSTLFRLPNSPLADDKFLTNHYRPEKKDYFFDRDPDIFRATLNYLRTGELHIPSYICGPAAKNELEFWGVKPNKIERCCWTNYNDWNSTLAALEQLERDRTGSMMPEEFGTHRKKTRWNTIQPKIWNFLNNPDTSIGSKIFGFLSLAFVILSIFSFIAGTTSTFNYYRTVPVYGNLTNNVTDNVTSGGSSSEMESHNLTGGSNSVEEELTKSKHPTLHVIDIVCLVFFTVEYIANLIFAAKKFRFVTSVMGLVDLIAILPDYIEMIAFAARPDMQIVEYIIVFRLARVFRIFRLIKHVPGLWILVYTLKASFGELILLFCFMWVGILVFSSLIYFAEERDNIESIPHAFWWAIITMTTVGYGDMYPVTGLGKLVGSLCAMSGLLMIGFSVPALVNNFMLFYKHVQYALQADREKTDEKNNAYNSSIGSPRIPTTNMDKPFAEKLPQNNYTDDNDNTNETAAMITAHVEGENGVEDKI